MLKFFTFLILAFTQLTYAENENPYELMICDYVKFDLLKMDKSGKIVWKHTPEGKVWDFVLHEKQIIYPIITNKFEVRCIDFEQKIKWSWDYKKDYREIINITADKSGLIISGQKPAEAIFMNFKGELTHKIQIPAKFPSHHGELGNIYPLENSYLVQLWGEGTVLEVDKNGKEIWRYQVPRYGTGTYPSGCVQDVLKLENGNVMIACGTQARILEVDKEGKIIWEFDKNSDPELNLTNACNLQMLKDGSILVTNFLRGNTGKGAHAFLFSKDRKITWKLTDHKSISAASQVMAIEE